MNKYQFEANGKKIAVEASWPVEAMGIANRQFSPLPQGAWMQIAGPVNQESFYWVAGNFVD